LFAVLQIVCVVKEWILTLAKTKRPLEIIIENQQAEKQHIKTNKNK